MVGVDAPALHAMRHRSDVEVVLVYKDSGRIPPDCPADRVFVENPESLEAVLCALARAGYGMTSFDGVYSGAESLVVLTATLAHMAEVPSITADVALHFRDKALQKQRLHDAGVPTAPFQLVDDVAEADPGSYSHLLPAVVKSIAGTGSKNTFLVRDAAEIAAAFTNIHAGETGGRTLIVERFMTGQEWSCDGIIYDGQVLFMALGRYSRPCLAALTEQLPIHVHKYSQDLRPRAYELAGPIVKDALAALGLQFGVFHLELFYQPDTHTFAFGECAARRGGGLAQELVLYQFGIDLARAAVESALGVRPDLSGSRPRSGVAGMGFLPIKGGYLLSCPDAAAITARPGVTFAHIEILPGAVLPDRPTDLFAHKIGEFTVFGEDDESVSEMLDSTQHWFYSQTVTVPPGHVIDEVASAAGFVSISGLDRGL